MSKLEDVMGHGPLCCAEVKIASILEWQSLRAGFNFVYGVMVLLGAPSY